MGEPLPATLSLAFSHLPNIPNLNRAFFCCLAGQTTPWPDVDDADGSGVALGCGA